MAEELRHLAVDLRQGDTELEECWRLPETEYRGTFYENPTGPLSIVEFPDTGDAYETQTCSRVVRENASWCRRLGYRYRRIDRADHEDDLYEIRSSASHRQGRRMPPSYLERQSYGSDAWPEPHCKHHLSTVHGVLDEDCTLAGYCQVVQCGEIVRVNTILGHADRLHDRIMWLLMLETFKWHIDEYDARYGLYFTHDSGHGPGLQLLERAFRFARRRRPAGCSRDRPRLRRHHARSRRCATSTPVSRSPAPPSKAARPPSVCSRLRGGAGRTPTGSPTPACTAPASTSTGNGCRRWRASIRRAGGSTNRTRSTSASMCSARKQWDVVTLDPFTSLVDRCAEDIGLWCALARRVVVLGTLTDTEIDEPDGWTVTDIRKRSDHHGGVYWTVLER